MTTETGQTFEDALATACAAIEAALGRLDPGRARFLVAVAGPPASGKTSFAKSVVGQLQAIGHGAIHVPMDGFHLDNALLEPAGLIARKGAPETFDAAGFQVAVKRLAREAEVILPDFDRTRDLAVAGRLAVTKGHRIAIVEGNYLCFEEPAWLGLAADWDLTVYLTASRDVLHARLIERWLGHGLDPDSARRRAEGNDIPNAERILARRAATNISIDTSHW